MRNKILNVVVDCPVLHESAVSKVVGMKPNLGIRLFKIWEAGDRA